MVAAAHVSQVLIGNRVSMQSLNRKEDPITSTHMHKLEASFHNRTTGNLTTGKVKESAPHSSLIRSCALHQGATTGQEHQEGKG